eukprot:tig00000498_g1587.t1
MGFPRLEEIGELRGHTDRAWCVAWSPDGKTLASCGGDKSVRIWRQEGGKWECKQVLDDGHQRTVRCVAWSPSGDVLASASFDGTTNIWQAKDDGFESVATLEGHENEVKAVAFDSSGMLVATCSRDKSVWVWEGTQDHDYECLSVLHGHEQDVKFVAWHPNKELLASASYDNTVRLWSETSGDDWECVDTIQAHESTVWSIAFDAKGEHLASCSDDLTVKVWKLPEVRKTEGALGHAQCVCTLSGHHRRTVFSLSWSHASGLLATGAADDAIRVFAPPAGGAPADAAAASAAGVPFLELAAGKEKAHGADVNCVAWCPSDGTLLASAGDDALVKLWRFHPE